MTQAAAPPLNNQADNQQPSAREMAQRRMMQMQLALAVALIFLFSMLLGLMLFGKVDYESAIGLKIEIPENLPVGQLLGDKNKNTLADPAAHEDTSSALDHSHDHDSLMDVHPGQTPSPYDKARTSIRLQPAPVPDNAEDTADGPLPIISKDGQKPWQVYARPALQSDAPKIAVLVTGLGIGRDITVTAIDTLPPDVTLAFDAQSPVLGSWLYRARQLGHETVLDIPAEPFDFPRSDAGPGSLLTSLSASENTERLKKWMLKGSGYVALTSSLGGQFVTNIDHMRPLMAELNRRGLMWVEQRLAKRTAGIPVAESLELPLAVETMRIAADNTPQHVARALEEIVLEARHVGRALVLMEANAMNLEQLNIFLQKLPEKGVVLVPVTALVGEVSSQKGDGTKDKHIPSTKRTNH